MAAPFLCEETMEWKAIRRQPRNLPWYPDWTIFAQCTPMRSGLSYSELDDIFFNYGRNNVKIKKAKKICAMCPVIKKCFRQNQEVPIGVFYGMTAIERWRARGLKGYPNTKHASSYFGQFYGKRINGIGMRAPRKK